MRRHHIARAAAAAFLGALASGAAAQTLASADRGEVAAVEAYLNRISTFKADFVQIAPSGQTLRGTMWIARPGGLRVEYKPPVKTRIFATPQWLIVEDCKTPDPQYLPLRSTPAGILVQERIALSGDLTVTDVRRDGPWLTLRVTETRAPEKGAMNLQFRTDPMRLGGWTVVDQNGARTQVLLENVSTGMALDRNIFAYISKCDDAAPRFGR